MEDSPPHSPFEVFPPLPHGHPWNGEMHQTPLLIRAPHNDIDTGSNTTLSDGESCASDSFVPPPVIMAEEEINEIAVRLYGRDHKGMRACPEAHQRILVEGSELDHFVQGGEVLPEVGKHVLLVNEVEKNRTEADCFRCGYTITKVTYVAGEDGELHCMLSLKCETEFCPSHKWQNMTKVEFPLEGENGLKLLMVGETCCRASDFRNAFRLVMEACRVADDVLPVRAGMDVCERVARLMLCPFWESSCECDSGPKLKMGTDVRALEELCAAIGRLGTKQRLQLKLEEKHVAAWDACSRMLKWGFLDRPAPARAKRPRNGD